MNLNIQEINPQGHLKKCAIFNNIVLRVLIYLPFLKFQCKTLARHPFFSHALYNSIILHLLS